MNDKLLDLEALKNSYNLRNPHIITVFNVFTATGENLSKFINNVEDFKDNE